MDRLKSLGAAGVLTKPVRPHDPRRASCRGARHPLTAGLGRRARGAARALPARGVRPDRTSSIARSTSLTRDGSDARALQDPAAGLPRLHRLRGDLRPARGLGAGTGGGTAVHRRRLRSGRRFRPRGLARGRERARREIAAADPQAALAGRSGLAVERPLPSVLVVQGGCGGAGGARARASGRRASPCAQPRGPERRACGPGRAPARRALIVDAAGDQAARLRPGGAPARAGRAATVPSSSSSPVTAASSTGWRPSTAARTAASPSPPTSSPSCAACGSCSTGKGRRRRASCPWRTTRSRRPSLRTVLGVRRLRVPRRGGSGAPGIGAWPPSVPTSC